MSPTASVAQASNGSGRIVPAKKQVSATSEDLISMEAQFAAHNYHPLPVVFDRAEGAKVWDPEGREYIDMLAAYSAVNQGHSHPKILQTLITQAPRLTLSARAFHNSIFPQFAKQVTSMFKYDMVLPMNTGAEAVETAMKLSRKWGYMRKGIAPGKARVISVAGNFHGRTLGVISMSTDPEAREGFAPYLENVGPTYEDENGEERIVRFGEISDLEHVFKLYGDSIASFLVEPIQGEAGVVIPPEGYLRAVSALCKKYNVLLICDEIQSGLGRTGKMLAVDWEGVRPDIILLGKALSGGMYPVSAILADKDVMLCIQPGEHGSTYGGNPLGCAIAQTALQVLVDEDMSGRAEKLGHIFRDGVKAINSPLVREVRGRGLFNAVVIKEITTKKGEKKTAWDVCLKLKERGVLAKPTHGDIIRFSPPLVIEEQDLKSVVKIIGEVLEEMTAESA